MPTITASHTLTVKDCMLGGRYIKRQSVFLKCVDVFAFLCVIHAIWTIHGNFSPSAFGYTVFPSLLLLAVVKFLPLLIMRINYAKQSELNMVIDWSISDNSIITSSAVSRTESSWSAFKKVILTPQGFLFMPSLSSFHVLPIRAFTSTEDIETVKSLARQHAAVFKEVK